MASMKIIKEHNKIILEAVDFLEQMSSCIESMDEYGDAEEGLKDVSKFISKARKFAVKDERK